MQKNIITLISKPRIILLSGILYIISQAAILAILHNLGSHDVFRIQTTLSSTVFLEIISRWESEGLLHFYKEHYYIDFIHPLIYSVFLSSMLALCLRKNRLDRYSGIVILPFLAGMMDITENIIHCLYLSSRIPVSQAGILISGMVSIIKWSLASLAILGIIVLLARYAYRSRITSGK